MRVNRMTGRLLVAVGLVALLIVPAAFAQKGKPPIPLDVVFTDGLSITDDVGDQNPITGKINGGPYSDGIDNVRAEIYYGDLYFDTNENKGDLGRRVNLTFPALSCTDCPSGGKRDVYIATHYFDDLAAMNKDDRQLKGFAINWAEGTNSYVLRFNQQSDGRHGNVEFTCIAGTPCTQWTAAPNGPAGLYIKRPATRKQAAYEQLLADVSMPFQMTLATKQ